MTTCNICCESYNQSTRCKVSCQYCAYEACKECCKTYILDKNRPQCMNTECDREWSRQFMQANFPKNFLAKDYRLHREAVLLNEQKALLPATQPLVEAENQIDELEREKEECERIKRDMELRMRVIVANQNAIRNTIGTGITKIRSEFVRACPDEHCRGFLSTAWKCGLCNKWACSKCHEIKGESRDCEHECNPDNVATAELLSKDTKPCPKCQMGIFKINGCDNMWCTQCHTSFNYRTGQIETHVHNPHYYEWLRQQSPTGEIPRDPNDRQDQCGPQEINDRTAHQIVSVFGKHLKGYIYYGHDKDKINTYVNQQIKYYTSLCRDMLHLSAVIVPSFPTNQDEMNQTKRIEYMKNKISEDEFKTAIQRIDKRCQKNREVVEVIRMVITAISDIVLRVIRENETVLNHEYNKNARLEIENLRKYANECFEDIGKAYGFKTLFLSEEFSIEGKKKRQKTYEERFPLRHNY